MDELENIYRDIIDPPNLIKHFVDLEDFRYWLRDGTIQDLEISLKLFEEYELYEHCQIILEEINKKN